MVILIIGISSGLGKATAQWLANRGHIVYGTVRHAVSPIKGVNYLRLDVTSEESVAMAVDDLYRKEGRIDVLINNAGIGIAGPIEFAQGHEWKYLLDVNFWGVVRVTQAVLPIMRVQRKGLVITISSIGGLMGLPFQGAYSASKFAIEGFCQALYNEVKQFNINVVIVNPGDFSTPFTTNRKIQSRRLVDTHYTSFDKTLEIIENNEKLGLPPERLAFRIEKIIEAHSPSFRYIVASPIQKLSVFLRKILPEKLFLNAIGEYYKVSSK